MLFFSQLLFYLLIGSSSASNCGTSPTQNFYNNDLDTLSSCQIINGSF